ncbi:MAG: hypothetical protein IPP74_06185 [Alphaproteobacteria bacterium]|nr:hypothetical protein [Alphaproteobacteria bacterium]
MVNLFSQLDKDAISLATQKAEEQTSAELVTIIARASDVYHSFILVYGLMLGTLVAALLWVNERIIHFPMLLVVQLAVIGLVAVIPWVGMGGAFLIPKHIRTQRASRRACEEYVTLSRQVPAKTPVLLLYVSLAEHYVQIVPNQVVREMISDEQWNEVIRNLTASIRLQGLTQSCVTAIDAATQLLVPHFPDDGGADLLKTDVVVMRK